MASGLLSLEQKVLWFEITVDDPVGMAIIYSNQNIMEYFRCLLLSEMILFENLVKQLSTSAKFSDQIEVMFILKIFVKLHDVGVI